MYKCNVRQRNANKRVWEDKNTKGTKAQRQRVCGVCVSWCMWCVCVANCRKEGTQGVCKGKGNVYRQGEPKQKVKKAKCIICMYVMCVYGVVV